MPNRKTFDPQERYDHSGRSVGHAEKNDLKADVSDAGDGEEGAGHRDPPDSRQERRDKPPRPPR